MAHVDINRLSRAAKYEAGKIANEVMRRYCGFGWLPRVNDYPPVVAACAKTERRIYTSETKHIREEHIHETLLDELEKLGPIGSRSIHANNSRVGYCAEPNAANKLLKHERVNTLDDIYFGDAYRPRTGVVIPPCGNCQRTFKNVIR